MSPELSRMLGRILGRNFVYPDERDRVIAAALDVDQWADLPAEIQALVERIGQRGPNEPGARFA